MKGLIKYNIKILLTPSYFIGWIFLLCLPLIFNFSLLNEMEMAKISEQAFVLVGIIWFCNLLNHEQAAHMTDLVYQMPVKQSIIFFIRVLFMCFSMVVAFSILLFIAYIQGSFFDFLKLLLGSMVGTLTLGMISLMFSQLTQEIAVGYMISFAYYYLELSTKGEYTRHFYLFGLISDVPYNKVLLIGVCLLTFIANCIILQLRTNGFMCKVPRIKRIK